MWTLSLGSRSNCVLRGCWERGKRDSWSGVLQDSVGSFQAAPVFEMGWKKDTGVF